VNNSLPRLIDGMVATLRKDVIPHVEGDYARGQAYGVIYMLMSLKLRASWSNAFLVEQLRALEEASRELEALDLADAPLPRTRTSAELPEASDLMAMRDAGDARLCELIDWLASRHDALPPETSTRAMAIVDRYLNRQSKFELSTSAKPMFAEMSGGAEQS
jgi:hypothetical protein